jgi:multidrug efflux system membrane fusion protein
MDPMRLPSLMLALAVIAGLAWWFLGRQDDPTAASEVATTATAATTGATATTAVQPDAAVPVMVLDSSAGPTTNRVVLRGRTEANRRVVVRAETTGLVASEPRQRGTAVAAGDVLCRIDPGSRPAQLSEAEARLAEASAEARAAESLSQKGFTAETTRFARLAQLQSAQAAVDLVQLDIARLEIRAPFGGVLETDTAELGARLDRGDPCATVIDMSQVKAVGFAAEQAVDQIVAGQIARVRLVTGRVAEGTISFISRVADPDTRTYEVEITLDNPDGLLRDGMTAELEIDLAPLVAHRLPQSALTLDDDGRLGVRLAVEGRARFVPVTILRDDPGGLWVTGLPETATVIVVGQEFVRDGRQVIATPVTWDDLG